METNILISILFGGGISSLVLFLGKNWFLESIKYDFKEKMEIFKADLSKDIEMLKATLDQQNIKYQINHSELAKFKYEKITKLFSLMTKGYNQTVEAYTCTCLDSKPLEQDLIDKIDKNNEETKNLMFESYLLLDGEINKKFAKYLDIYDEFSDRAIGLTIHFSDDEKKSIQLQIKNNPQFEEQINEARKNTQNVMRSLTEQMGIVLDEIKVIFRSALYVSET